MWQFSHAGGPSGHSSGLRIIAGGPETPRRRFTDASRGDGIRIAAPESLIRRGGESGIRTHGRFDPSPVFKTGALNRSAISPEWMRVGAGGLSHVRRFPQWRSRAVRPDALDARSEEHTSELQSLMRH